MHEVGAELFVYFPQELTKNTLYEKQINLNKIKQFKDEWGKITNNSLSLNFKQQIKWKNLI